MTHTHTHTHTHIIIIIIIIIICVRVYGMLRLVILDGATGAVKSINGRGDVSAFKTAPTKCLEQWAANDVVEDMGGDSWGCNIL